MKAFAYTRVSTGEQAQKYSLEAQRDEIAQYCAAHGIEVVEWFEDHLSGTKLVERAQLMALLDRAEEEVAGGAEPPAHVRPAIGVAGARPLQDAALGVDDPRHHVSAPGELLQPLALRDQARDADAALDEPGVQRLGGVDHLGRGQPPELPLVQPHAPDHHGRRGDDRHAGEHQLGPQADPRSAAPPVGSPAHVAKR